jgi:hypothetical protein
MTTTTKKKAATKTKARAARKDGWVTLYSPKMGRGFKVAARANQIKQHGMPLAPEGNKMTTVLKKAA